MPEQQTDKRRKRRVRDDAPAEKAGNHSEVSGPDEATQEAQENQENQENQEIHPADDDEPTRQRGAFQPTPERVRSTAPADAAFDDLDTTRIADPSAPAPKH